jgi:hypothetical protein
MHVREKKQSRHHYQDIRATVCYDRARQSAFIDLGV